MHMNIGGIGPQIRQNGPVGVGSTIIGAWGMNNPAHHSGTIDWHELQPANSITNQPLTTYGAIAVMPHM